MIQTDAVLAVFKKGQDLSFLNMTDAFGDIKRLVSRQITAFYALTPNVSIFYLVL